jgi:hypothetical protein
MWPGSASTGQDRSVGTGGSVRMFPPGMGSTRAETVWPETSSKCQGGMACIPGGTLQTDSRGTCGKGSPGIGLFLEARMSQGGRSGIHWPLRQRWSRFGRSGRRSPLRTKTARLRRARTAGSARTSPAHMVCRLGQSESPQRVGPFQRDTVCSR